MIVRLHDVDKVYANGVVALQGLDLEVREGEFLSLLGPSGCGKSTVLRLIAGLGEVSAGRIAWPAANGHPGMAQGDIGFVFQEPTLMPWATVWKNVLPFSWLAFWPEEFSLAGYRGIFEDDFGLETLILCPKNLVKMWEDHREQYRLRGRVLSLSLADRELKDLRRYRLVVIDESHNLRNREGKLIPLQAVANIRETVGPLSVAHMGQVPAVTISFNLAPGVSLSQATERIEAIAATELPATVAGTFQGTAAAFTASLQNASALRFWPGPLNRAPTANPGGPYGGVPAVPISFNGAGSSDPENDPLTYRWNFGDGTTATGASPTHAYAAKGAYTATLIVNDGIHDSPPVTTTARGLCRRIARSVARSVSTWSRVQPCSRSQPAAPPCRSRSTVRIRAIVSGLGRWCVIGWPCSTCA